MNVSTMKVENILLGMKTITKTINSIKSLMIENKLDKSEHEPLIYEHSSLMNLLDALSNKIKSYARQQIAYVEKIQVQFKVIEKIIESANSQLDESHSNSMRTACNRIAECLDSVDRTGNDLNEYMKRNQTTIGGQENLLFQKITYYSNIDNRITHYLNRIADSNSSQKVHPVDPVDETNTSSILIGSMAFTSFLFGLSTFAFIKLLNYLQKNQINANKSTRSQLKYDIPEIKAQLANVKNIATGMEKFQTQIKTCLDSIVGGNFYEKVIANQVSINEAANKCEDLINVLKNITD